MPKNRTGVSKDIQDAYKIIREVMQDNLYRIADNVISEIRKNFRSLAPAQELKAIKSITNKGLPRYKAELRAVLAVVSSEALKKVRKEVPKASKVKLAECDEGAMRFGEFEALPPKLRQKIQAQSDLLVETQKDDLDKAIAFQFTSSYDSTDSDAILEKDLYDSAENFIDGSSVNGGADATAATTVNETREVFFTEPEVLNEIEAFAFMNDDPKTDICIDLSNDGDGKVFGKDDPEMFRYTPPLHFGCKSYIIAVLPGDVDPNEIEQLKPSSSALEKEIQFKEKKLKLMHHTH